ncbi:hypothetical protein [Enterobacter roggenkampii]
MMIHGKEARREKKLGGLGGFYKPRFGQESVVRVDQPVWVQF